MFLLLSRYYGVLNGYNKACGSITFELNYRRTRQRRVSTNKTPVLSGVLIRFCFFGNGCFLWILVVFDRVTEF